MITSERGGRMQAQYGQSIREIRNKLGYTQKEFSEIAGISLSALQRYESNERQPTIEALRKIASAFELSLGEFLFPSETKIVSRNASDEDPARMVTTEAEFTMLTAYRAADDRAREDALVILQAHKK